MCARTTETRVCAYVRASVGVLRMCRLRPTRACPHTGQVDGRITNMDPNVPTMQVIFVYISVSANLCIHACLLLQGRCGNVDVFVFTHKNRFAYPYNSKCLCVHFYIACIHAYAAAAKAATVATASMLWRVCVHAKTVRIIRLDV